MVEIKLVIAIAFLTFVYGWGIGVFRGLRLAHKATMKTIDRVFSEDK
jgi:hypothetical protein